MIYFVQNSLTFHIKIGFTAKDDVKDRIKSFQTGNSGILYLLATRPGEEWVEKALHKQFASYQVRQGTSNEWYHPGPELIQYIVGCNAFEMARQAVQRTVQAMVAESFPEAKEEIDRREKQAERRREEALQKEIASCKYAVGMNVKHQKYGVGFVREAARRGEDEIVRVHFGRLGVKVFIADRADLEIINTKTQDVGNVDEPFK